MKKTITGALLVAFSLAAAGQKKENFKFEKITPATFEKKVYDIDTNAAAVVLGDVGSTEIVGNNKGWFSFVFKRHLRIHVLGKSGYDEAKMEVPLYSSGQTEEKLESLKATTYNLEDGKIVETKMSKDNVFTEKVTRTQSLKKFTLPNVKEGSILDIEYRIHSDYLYTLQPWSFQRSIPCLWSEYNLSLPQFMDYAFISRGYLPFYIQNREERRENYIVAESGTAEATQRVSIPSNVTDYRWVMKNVPAFKEESFTSSAKNHISHIQFQLSAFREPLRYRNLISTWPEMTKALMQDEDFGKRLDKSNNWLSDVVNPLIAEGTPLQKAKKIYAFVRDNFTCTSQSGLYLSQSLKDVLRSRSGRVSELNLLLASMLKFAGIEAEPIMLSTRSNGLLFTPSPMLSRFNYVITGATIEGNTYYLDASQPHLGFGRLPTECYNGQARVINAEATPVLLMTDSLKETKVTSILMVNTDKGERLGTVKQVPGYYESQKIRARLRDKGKEQFFKEVAKNHGEELIIQASAIDSLSLYEYPVGLSYEFKLDKPTEDILYVDPLFGEGYKQNPFKSAERAYPVEMPYAIDQTVTTTMFVPAGYKVDEMPKPIKVKFNEEGEGWFEYLISQSEDVVSLRTRVKFTKANFHPDEYEMLREFFDLIVKKQTEQIVFKKIK